MPPGPVPDVVVVGAGAAGLAAAATLRRAGRPFLVLEARDRLGGRIHTVRPPRLGRAVELGAEFVHGDAPLTRELAGRAGARVEELDGDSLTARDGRVLDEDAWERIQRVLEALSDEPGRDRSFAEWLEGPGSKFPERDRSAALAFVEGFFAAHSERAGVRALAGEGVGGARRGARLPGGYDGIVAILARDLGTGIRRGRVVRRVSWSRGRVRLEGLVRATRVPFAPVEARAAVLTVPIGVLRGPSDALGGVTFEPPVPAWEEAMEGVEAGPVVRLVLAFEGPLWGSLVPLPADVVETRPPSFLHAPDRRFNAFWTPRDDAAAAGPGGRVPGRSEGPGARGTGSGLVTLTAWSGGGRAADLPVEQGELVAAALDDLAGASGADRGRLEEACRGAWFHDWRRDVFALGAYSYLGVGGVDAPDRLARPVDGTLFMAGEATSSSALGTVEGALASGARAARLALEALR